MSETVTGALLIALPILFNVGFTLLAMRFDYPDVLREPTGEVLRRFREGGASLILICRSPVLRLMLRQWRSPEIAAIGAGSVAALKGAPGPAGLAR